MNKPMPPPFAGELIPSINTHRPTSRGKLANPGTNWWLLLGTIVVSCIVAVPFSLLGCYVLIAIDPDRERAAEMSRGMVIMLRAVESLISN